MKNYLSITLLLLFGVALAQDPPVRVQIESITDYGPCEAFARRAAQVLEKVLNSEEFKNAVRTRDFTQKNGNDNNGLLANILRAHEQQGAGGQDGVVNLRLRTIKAGVDDPVWMKRCKLDSRTRTIGIDGQGDGVAAICPEWLKKYCDENNVAELAAHFMHEYMHILGYEHAWYSKYRSAVYKIGDLIEEIIRAHPEY